MSRFRRACALALVVALSLESVLLAVDSKGALYFGGTVSAFNTSKEPVEGNIDTSKEDALLFTASNKPFKGESFSTPYAQVIDLEYGQKAGRRVGATTATTVLLGPVGLLLLFSKKRQHFLTIGFKDASDKDNVAVIELGKGLVRTSLAIIETRSGKKIQFQDDEARKYGKGGG